MTLAEAFNLYADNKIRFKGQSFKTEETHFLALRSLATYIGNPDIEDLSFEQVRKWHLALVRSGKSPGTIKMYLVKLRLVLAWANANRFNCLNHELIELPRLKKKVPGVCTVEEVRRLIDACTSLQNKLIVSMLYSTGVRINELCAIDRSMVDKDYFTVGSKGGDPRPVFIDARTRALLDEHLKRRSAGYDVFVNNRGKTTARLRYHVPGDSNPALFISRQTSLRITPATIQCLFRDIRVRAGFSWPVHPHSLRHSFATDLHLNGAPLYAVSKSLGHKWLDTTAIYLHIWDNTLQEVHNKFHKT